MKYHQRFWMSRSDYSNRTQSKCFKSYKNGILMSSKKGVGALWSWSLTLLLPCFTIYSPPNNILSLHSLNGCQQLPEQFHLWNKPAVHYGQAVVLNTTISTWVIRRILFRSLFANTLFHFWDFPSHLKFFIWRTENGQTYEVGHFENKSHDCLQSLLIKRTGLFLCSPIYVF